ncbi:MULTISPECIES: hypothetical protein [unclassified Janthinobacterium]|uniref:hypothetical protein n=1 Tax=unclassified Janthinobacterium TaxID=2610881 RepID=UPI0018DECF6B|nr:MULTISPECIES: hypothetical protein [unclassified Janthinobacterium]MEC5159563.1 hypothetical protein [Janthinobacterium sp. CG_S6]
MLDDELTRLWQVAPPPRYASRRCTASRWTGRRVGVDWRTGAPFYAAAPGPLLARLEGVAGAHGLTIIAVVPHFIATWNRRQGALAHRRPAPHLRVLHPSRRRVLRQWARLFTSREFVAFMGGASRRISARRHLPQPGHRPPFRLESKSALQIALDISYQI